MRFVEALLDQPSLIWLKNVPAGYAFFAGVAGVAGTPGPPGVAGVADVGVDTGVGATSSPPLNDEKIMFDLLSRLQQTGPWCNGNISPRHGEE